LEKKVRRPGAVSDAAVVNDRRGGIETMRAVMIFLYLGLLLTASLGRAEAQAKRNPVVVIDTTLGAIRVELYPDKAPISVKNFLSYIEEKHYDGLLFHRVVPGFMIQGGGLYADLNEKPANPTIKNEAGNGLKNDRGTLAMARRQPVDSANAQFFINVKDNAFLNHKDETPAGFGYAVFGKVVQGMDVVDKIVAVPATTKGPFQNVPTDPIVIRSVRLIDTP
jgi:peptidyl-prolyl cis-trans isomerase A (cyclophilin A)